MTKAGISMKLTLPAAALIFVVAASIAEASCLTVKDKRGVSTTINLPVRRAVFHINYEFIPALGIWDRVVSLGSTAFTNDLVLATKPEKSVIPVIGDINKINIEQVIKLKPDVLITWSYNKDELNFIEQKGKIRVVAYYPDNLGEFYEMFTTIGAMFGKKRKAEQVINEMENVFEMIRQRTADIRQDRRKKILWLGDKPTVVSGKLDAKNDIIQMVGAKNSAAELAKSSGEVSLEQIMSWNPDLIFITWHATYSANDILANPQWRHIKAVKNKQVYKAPPWSTWSPRLAPIALWMASKAYPERFRDVNIYGIIDHFYRKVFDISYGKVNRIAN
jgi:iron complex transport system substrate-binding protein